MTFYWFTNSFGKKKITAFWQGHSKAVWRKGNDYFAERNGFLVRVPNRQLINVCLTQTACLQTQRAEEQRSLGHSQKPVLFGNLAPLKQMFKGFVLSLHEILFVWLREILFACVL